MPTIRQTKAIHKVVENGGNVSRAMLDVGYSPNTAHTPQKLTESKAWQEYMDEYLSDATLAKVHAEGLQATKLSGTGGMRMNIKADGEISEMGHSDLEVPDYATRHKYLDSAYKLKGAYAAEKHVNLNIEIEASEEVKELTKQLNDIHRGTKKEETDERRAEGEDA